MTEKDSKELQCTIAQQSQEIVSRLEQILDGQEDLVFVLQQLSDILSSYAGDAYE